ncbi:uncharacterized protein LOC107646736 [Arachis ipaensis]|uniref:uncharacterized protein LOC107646736 n=1 Tax=Arachis ipaensis TaxID=130454 RepID=UPI0007AF96FB|nr:uncharacterized protein LOC107646736 [Arachis ipaensis]
MASDESFVALVHYRGSIKKKMRSGIKFTDKDPLCVFLKPSMSFAEFKDTILQKLSLLGIKRVEKLFYRIPISALRDDVKYDSFIIGSDEDLQVLHHCHRQFPEVRTLELLAKLVDAVSSSGGSNWNPESVGHPACSSFMPVRSFSAAPFIALEAGLVASPSFAFNVNHDGDPGFGETGPLGEEAFVTPRPPAMVPLVGEVGVPDGVEDALLDDDEDDVEPATIADDSDDDIPWPTPIVGGGASSSGTNQYPPHFSALDLDAMAPEADPGVPVGFGARETQNTGVVSEFQVGQQFQDKEEVLLSVKTYSIRRRVEYKVLESDNRKYYGKCKEFGSGCAWLIRVSLRQCRGIWKVKRYNGPHTCLATSISGDHRKLDYHVISTFILPMIRADATVSIKVLQNATEAHFGFRNHVHFTMILSMQFAGGKTPSNSSNHTHAGRPPSTYRAKSVRHLLTY